MHLSKKRLSFTLIFLLIPFFLIGCVQSLPLITLAPTAVQLGTVAYQSVEEADINASIVSDVTKKELKKIKRIAIFLGKENPTRPYGRIGNLGAVVGDNLCIELMKLGFQVCGWSEVEKYIGGKDTQTALSIDTMAKVGKLLGVQAIITGSITAGQTCSLGMIGVGRMITVVQSASLKIIGVKNADTLMIITIAYKIGQNPRVAAEGMAIVLKAKFEDPAVDVKEMLKQEGKETG
ncbi:MAG: hypothetical protein U9N40_05065 [Euryarchaeota archaeon]|nr:hypothetical protein [Euryarchaeota archaeon]